MVFLRDSTIQNIGREGEQDSTFLPKTASNPANKAIANQHCGVMAQSSCSLELERKTNGTHGLQHSKSVISLVISWCLGSEIINLITRLDALKKSLFSKGEKHSREAVHRGKYLKDAWPWAGHVWEAAHSSPALSKVGAMISVQGLAQLMTSLPSSECTAMFLLIAEPSGLLKSQETKLVPSHNCLRVLE